MLMNCRSPLVRPLLLSLAMGICLASPAYADHNYFGKAERSDGNNGDGRGHWTIGGDDDGGYGHWTIGGDDDRHGTKKGPGPAVPEPSSWLAMGVGLLVVGRYLRRSS